MRRIDVLWFSTAVFGTGGVAYLICRFALGLDGTQAGIWSQVVLVGVGVVAWVASYLMRAFTQTMTYNQQLKDYEDAVLQKRLEALSPEELAQLQAEVEAERAAAATPPE
ncbi:MAG: DUF3007 family protein [Synechococcales cyanobacterium RM1_1_8]|nr:DUF3007 family protein [Synechococcales cyanobacterium RM1_1_8]